MNWRITAVAAVFLAVIGLHSLLTMPRSVDPHFPNPFVITTVVLPGADAAQMEAAVARPIETALQGLDRVRDIRSTSTDGLTVIPVEFDHGTDAEQALDRVVREVTALRGRLPAGIQRIEYRRPRTTEAALVQLALVSDTASWRRMAKYAEDARDRLAVVDGVRAVGVDGLASPEVRVAVDDNRLRQFGIPLADVAAALSASGAESPVGSVGSEGRRLNVDAGGAFRSIEEIRAVPLRATKVGVVRVGDVSLVDWAEQERRHVARFNDRRSVFLTVKQKDGIDALALRRSLDREVTRLRDQLPPDMTLVRAFDQSRDIQEKLSHLSRDFAIALVLVALTLLPLGLRSSLTVMISIPLSLAGGVLALDALGYSLNQISISGFILSLGLLVDDSIVVVESIARHLRDRGSVVRAVVTGTREIAPAVLGATGVLVFAFLPLCFLPESGGDFVRGLPVAVISAVTSSMLVSLIVIPCLFRAIARAGPERGMLLDRLKNGIQRFYAPLLRRTLDRPKTSVALAMALCAALLALVPVLGVSMFPSADVPYLLVRVELPEGSSVADTDRAVARVSGVLAGEPAVRNRMDNAGRGNPQIFYNVLPRDERSRYGEVFVTLDRWDVRDGPAMIERLRRRLQGVTAGRVTILRFQNGPPVEAPLAVRVSGPDLSVLRSVSERVAREMEALPGLRDVDDPLREQRLSVRLRIDEGKAGLLGIMPGEIRRATRLAISGESASRLRDEEGDEWPVVVRLPLRDAYPLSSLAKIDVPTGNGGAVPLLQVAQPELRSVPAQITRRRLQRSVTVAGYVAPGFLTSAVTHRLQERLSGVALPSGYEITYGGEAEAARRNYSGLFGMGLLALFGIMAVIVLEFGSFREAAVVAGVVPLGTTGGLLALLLTGNSLSFLAMIGFVALIGIEMKNSILLVDFAGRLRRQGVELRRAVELAGEVRFLPVLLTSVTAIGGLLPLAVGGSALYSPLAWVIIGGLVSSTVLSRVVTPAMYLVAARRGRPAVHIREAAPLPSARR